MPWNNLAVLYLQQGRLDLAQQAFITAQNIDPNDTVPFIGLAMLNETIATQRAMEKAQAGFSHAISLQNTAVAQLGLAYAAFVNG